MQVPELDRAFSGLIQDLHTRRMLDRTLVLLLTEFGRSGTLNAAGGRDHCGSAFSVVLAGGGIRGGQVIGATDADGSRVLRDPVDPPALAVGVLRRFGTQLSPRDHHHS